jgi:hypothetical protein
VARQKISSSSPSEAADVVEEQIQEVVAEEQMQEGVIEEIVTTCLLLRNRRFMILISFHKISGEKYLFQIIK